MEGDRVVVNPEETISTILNVIAHLISPILFIWSINTLFRCEIPISFKTWLAGIVLIMLMRYHVKGTASYNTYFDGYEDEEEDEEDYEDEIDMNDKRKPKARITSYNDYKNKKKSNEENK